MAEIYDDPSTVGVVDGTVTVNGPDGVDVALTPDAAAETSDRLMESASTAAAEQRAADQDAAARSAWDRMKGSGAD